MAWILSNFNFTLYIILSRDMPLLKSDFSSLSEILVWPSGGHFQSCGGIYFTKTKTCRQKLMDFLPSLELHLSVLSSSYDKIGLNLKYEQAFISALENISGPSV